MLYNNPWNQWGNPYNNMNNGVNNWQQRQDVVRVNGRNGADSYPLPPNSSILMLDENEPVVWLKTTDGAGYPTVNAYNISPAQSQEQIDNDRFTALEGRIAALEGILNEQSNSSSTRSKSVGKG